MEKILTVSIAAYNVADYIRQGLDSLVTSKYIDDLEIFVVDDGGQDETLAIAKEYQEKYPKSIIPIHKENGGYGTTVNYSLEHATGKYFKLLDGDDWFDTAALDKLVEALKQIETDVVVTSYNKVTGDKSATVKFADAFPAGEQTLSELKAERAVGMWGLCYKLEVLKNAQLKLPGKVFFTDQYYALLPYKHVQTIQYLDYPVYQYRLGRDGQSVSKESRIKNIEMLSTITKDLARFLNEQKGHPNYDFMLYRGLFAYRNNIKSYLLMPINGETRQKLKVFDDEIKALCPDLYEAFANHRKIGKFIGLCRRTNYLALPLIKLIYPKGFPNF